MITEAMQQVLGDRVVGICDSPIGLGRRAARALGLDPDARPRPDYVGLNHLGWLRSLSADGVDVLPRLLADDALLGSIEEGRLFGPTGSASLGAMPNEYLYYYYFTRDAVASIRGRRQTRGEFLLEQQHGFYAAVAAHPPRPWRVGPRTARAGRDVHEGGPATTRRGARRRPTSRAAATRAWRWRSWRPSPGASGPR